MLLTVGHDSGREYLLSSVPAPRVLRMPGILSHDKATNPFRWRLASRTAKQGSWHRNPTNVYTLTMSRQDVSSVLDEAQDEPDAIADRGAHHVVVAHRAAAWPQLCY